MAIISCSSTKGTWPWFTSHWKGAKLGCFRLFKLSFLSVSSQNTWNHPYSYRGNCDHVSGQTKMSSSIHLTSLNKLSKPIFLGGDHKGRSAEEREKTILFWFITHQHIHFSCSAWNKHKTCRPSQAPFC